MRIKNIMYTLIVKAISTNRKNKRILFLTSKSMCMTTEQPTIMSTSTMITKSMNKKWFTTMIIRKMLIMHMNTIIRFTTMNTSIKTDQMTAMNTRNTITVTIMS